MLQSLSSRLSPNHEQLSIVNDEIKRTDAGIYGEQYIFQLLKEQGYLVITDITVHQQQIDILVFHRSYCALFEVKNIKGQIQFTDSPRQMLRKKEDGTLQIFSSPFAQIENNLRAIQSYFNVQKIKLPLYSAVVFPFHNATFNEMNFKVPILIGKDILNYLSKLDSLEPIYSARQIKSMIKHLQEISRPFTRYPLCERYNLKAHEIMVGCRCENCNALPMVRAYASWRCPACGLETKDAHIRALQEYACLISDTITLREAMRFLVIDNRYLARRMLLQAGSTRTGRTRSTKYTLKRF